MLTDAELKELNLELQTCKRPIIFFDDDTDGLCAFLLFYAYLKGFCEDIKGVPVKDNPELRNHVFLRKIEEFRPDKIFILDKPLVHQDFLDSIKQKVIWLDHHPMVDRKNVHYYNPLKHPSPEFPHDNRPTTYWAYKVLGEYAEKHSWIAATGCCGDWFVPGFIKEITEQYPDLVPKNLKIRNPGTILYESRLGVLCRIFEFNMKSQTIDALRAVKILTRINDPHEILDQTSPQGRLIYKQYEDINNVYETLKAGIKVGDERLVLYVYSGSYALSGELANELLYHYPDKFIIVGRENNESIVCSLRSESMKVSDILEKSLQGIHGNGGGHEHACGAGIRKSDFLQFIDNIKKNLELAYPEKAMKKAVRKARAGKSVKKHKKPAHKIREHAKHHKRN